jgi:glutamate synthase (NADPH/NADH) small chain|tara:strand:- start:290 stop:1768 length:1479 start_codon:yes stop_codon:yes gene_type:complete
MGNPFGFTEFRRKMPAKRSSGTRVGDWREIYLNWDERESRNQASRCMDCGVPFCNKGCPLGNLIPEFNDLVYEGNWEEAINRLHATNNFPEFTGRICPAPCEESCILSINNDPVTIEMIEKTISETAWNNNWIKPEPPTARTGKKVAVVGSGPAGLAAAQQLNRAGHSVSVFERSEVLGGLLTIGIPEFKLEKSVVYRRIQQIRAEGVKFYTKTNMGIDISHTDLQKKFDAICLAGGSTVPRDLSIEGRNLSGIHFAMDYLSQQNAKLRGETFLKKEEISAVNKNVVIIGGGDTGADCLGTAHRQKASNVVQIEILPRPPILRLPDNPWPERPFVFKSSNAHEEGGERDFSILTKKFIGNKQGRVTELQCVRVEWKHSIENNQTVMGEITGSDFIVKADLVLIAMGFIHPQHEGLLDSMQINYDNRGNVESDATMKSNIDGVFACGDMENGQSLVVQAIASGRRCARNIDVFLVGNSSLPSVQEYVRPFHNT